MDIDVQDHEIVEKLITWCQDNIGPTVQRVGQVPKTLLAYRTDQPFTKMASKTYECYLGFTHRIEILGDGQQL